MISMMQKMLNIPASFIQNPEGFAMYDKKDGNAYVPASGEWTF